VHVPWFVPFTSTPLCSLFFTAFLSFADFSHHLLLSQSIFRRATLVIDVPMHCQLHSLFLILALAYGSHFHFVWWCFDHWNFTFPSLTFVTFLLIPFHGLATLVLSVPMCCQPNCLFVNLVLYHGSLFQLILCETMHGNLPFILFKFGQPAFHINVFCWCFVPIQMNHFLLFFKPDALPYPFIHLLPAFHTFLSPYVQGKGPR